MKDKKRRLETFSFYDRTGIEAHLKRMAEKGWMISEITTLGWIYKRVEPRSLAFAVSYYPKASEFDPEPTEGQNVYHDLSARTGWQFVCSSAQMQVFCTSDENPIPIETDPVLEVEMIHKSAKKSFILTHLILLAVGALNGLLFISRLLGDPIGVLASPTNLFTGFAWIMLMQICFVELIGYYCWRSKALKAAEHGEFIDTPNHAQFQKVVLVILIFGLFYWLGNVISIGDPLMKWVAVIMLLYAFGLILIVNMVKQFLKKKKASRETNLTITLTVDIVLAIVLMASITFGTLKLSQAGFFARENEETYEHNGMTWVVHQDELPLTVEDLVETDYSEYHKERRGDESLLLANFELTQRPRFGVENYNEIPQLQYRLVGVKLPFLYDICKNRMIYEKESRYDESPLEYREQDPAPWNAKEAYRLYDPGMGYWNTYLICYGNTLVEIRFEWEPTTDQMAIVAEKLGGVSS